MKGPPVQVGAAVSTTGSNGKQGEYQAQGYQLWEEQVNLRGGLLGRPVKLTIYDDASDPVNARKLYEKLTGEDKMDLVLGPYANSATQVASTTTEKAHTPLLAAGDSSPDLWKRSYKYLFGVYATPDVYLNATIDLALKSGYKTAAIVGENTVVPAATIGGAIAYAKAKGLQVTYQEKYPASASDLAPLVKRMKDLNPDVVLGASYQSDAELLTRQCKAADFAPHMLAFSNGASAQEFAQDLAGDAEGVLCASLWEPSLKTPGNQEFVDAFQRKFSREPNARAAAGYAGGQILEAAIGKAKSLEHDALRDALAGLETQTILPGVYRVDDAGAQVGHLPVVVQWQGKERVVVWPDSLGTGKPILLLRPWTGR